MQAVVPEDVDVRLEFDQSGYVSGALKTLVREALIGAALTGLMVLLFLRDWRSALVVVTTIPLSLLAAVVCLWASGQTINIMTLGGSHSQSASWWTKRPCLMENIHSHMCPGDSTGGFMGF